MWNEIINNNFNWVNNNQSYRRFYFCHYFFFELIINVWILFMFFLIAWNLRMNFLCSKFAFSFCVREYIYAIVLSSCKITFSKYIEYRRNFSNVINASKSRFLSFDRIYFLKLKLVDQFSKWVLIDKFRTWNLWKLLNLYYFDNHSLLFLIVYFILKLFIFMN